METSVPVDQKPVFQGGWRLANKSSLGTFKQMLPYDNYLGVVVKSNSVALKDLTQAPLKEGEFLC